MSSRVSSHWGLQDPRFDGPVVPTVTPATISTAGAVTYTTDQILGGLIRRDTNGGARTDILPTASLLVAAMQGVQVGHSFQFDIKNIAAAANTLTVSAGAGGTTEGTMTVAQNNIRYFQVVFTNVGIGTEAYTVYSLGGGAY